MVPESRGAGSAEAQKNLGMMYDQAMESPTTRKQPIGTARRGPGNADAHTTSACDKRGAGILENLKSCQVVPQGETGQVDA